MQGMRDPAVAWQQRTPSKEAPKKRSSSSDMVAILMSLKVSVERQVPSSK
jgi:hypothetical protein